MRAAVGSLGVLCLLACGPAPRVASRVGALKPVAPSLASGSGSPRTEQYRLIPPRAERRRTPGALRAEQRLLGGRRILESGGRVQLADTVAVDALTQGREVPGFSGGGFLFWNAKGVYRSRTLLSRLEPLATLSFTIVQASFGPGFTLLRGSDGGQLRLDGQQEAPRPRPPLGLVDVAAAPDGRVVMALEFGRYAVSLDHNVTYREVQDELGRPVHALSAEPLGFVLQNDALVTLSPQGRLVDRGAPARDKTVSLWPGGESALEQAVAFGVARGGRALVAQSASLVEVDLESGEILKHGPQLLPGLPNCQLIESGSDLLMKCVTREALSLLGQLESERPVLEQSFEPTAQLVFGFEHLLVNRDCSGAQRPYTVCVRDAGGTWRTVSAAELAPVAPKPTPSLPAPRPRPAIELGYGFKSNGNVVSFVRRGDMSGYRDLVTDQFVELKHEIATGGASELACRVEDNGLVSCLGRAGPQRVAPDGSLLASPHRFAWVERAGERALGFDDLGKLFQSDDGGSTWRQVASPPHPALAVDRAAKCSAVGCRFGGWLRLGWEPLAPVVGRPPESIALPGLAPSVRPVLACAASTEPKVLTRRALPEQARMRGFGMEDAPSDDFVVPIEMTATWQESLGEMAQRGMMRATPVRDSHDGSLAPSWTGSAGLSFRFIDYFDANPVKRSAGLSVAALLRAMTLAGSDSPNFAFEDQLGLQGVPVLSADSAKAHGLTVTLEQASVWLSNGRALPLAVQSSSGVPVVVSSLAEKGGGLVALMLDGSVVRYARGASVQLFRLPHDLASLNRAGTADALALDPLGDFAVLRFTSGEEAPNESYPVLAYRPGREPEVLAPFSSVVAASDPACSASAGYRAIVLGRQGWLKVTRYSQGEIGDDWGFSAIVRWSADRVCLEALETADSSFSVGDQALPTRIVATFSANQRASRQGFAPGIELLQPLHCRLERSR